MADTFTALLRLVLQETGGNENTWGTINNASAIQLLETAIAGRQLVDVTLGDIVLTTVNGAVDQARNAILVPNGNPGIARDVTVPSTAKLYVVSNETSPGFDVTIKTAAGSGVAITSGQIAFVYVDPVLDDVFFVSSGTPASETVSGIAELATQAETDAGSDDLRIVTPLKLATFPGAGDVVVTTGTFTPTWTGFSADPTATMRWTKFAPPLSGANSLVILRVATGNGFGTSNATGFTLASLPAAITPATFGTGLLPVAQMVDNAVVNLYGAFSINTANVMTFFLGDPAAIAGFTAAANKGFSNNAIFTYGLVE